MRLTGASTFGNFKELLDNNDDLLIKQIKYLAGEQFKQETNGYLKKNFQFFMAVVLRGINSNSKFLELCDIGESTWSAQASMFVFADKVNRGFSNINNDLKKIDENTTMSCFLDGTWINLKVKDDKGQGVDVFYKQGKSIFADVKEKNGIVQPGAERAKAKMKQIAEFLINGKQITDQGGFSYMTEPITLLRANKQLIMNGAPGTGKTFSAKNTIADKLLEISDNKKIKMDMVQFHPSYDYTDFIEGIRPVMVSNLQSTSASSVTTSVGYTLKNGIFKKFCRRAGVIERLWAAYEEVNDTNINEYLYGEDEKIKDFWKDWIKKEKNQSTIVQWNREIENNKENSKSGIEPKSDSILMNLELPPFLFIIDEINRAEISKVFGETMYCLDADYRGPKGMIATQYSSMATNESFFVSKDNDKFFIPSNVYIIGTMNDIDRSVEVFDFALRRRFAWFEVNAEDVMETVLNAMEVEAKLGQYYDDYKTRIKNLNDAIEKDLKLNRHYHLGPSYFAKIELYLSSGYNDARREVWNNHISQILYEYVKGKRTEEKIKDIWYNFCN